MLENINRRVRIQLVRVYRGGQRGRKGGNAEHRTLAHKIPVAEARPRTKAGKSLGSHMGIMSVATKICAGRDNVVF